MYIKKKKKDINNDNNDDNNKQILWAKAAMREGVKKNVKIFRDMRARVHTRELQTRIPFFFLFPVVSSYDESVPRQQTKFLKYHGWGKVEKHACLIFVVCFFPWPCTRINKNKSKNKHGELKKNTVVVASRNSGGWNSDSIGTVTQRGLL